MSQVKISDIHAGKPDAREDISRNKREFMNSYLIPPNLNVKTLKDGDICYIVGNKGLGKTAALRYLNQCFWEDNHATISTFLLFERDYTHQVKSGMESIASQSFVTYNFDEEEEPGQDTYKQDFSLVWRWHLFLTIVRDNKDGKIFFKDKNWKSFERFVTGIFKKEAQVTVSGGIDLSLPENIPSLLKFIQPHISIELPEFNIGRREYSFPEAMQNAEEWFLKLKDSRGVTPYYIFVDELDIHYGDEKAYLRDLRLVHDLALEVKRFNEIILKQGWHQNTKVFCTLRPEVIQAIDENLSSRSLKREMEGYRFDLSWASDSSETYTLPIMKLFLKRIEAAENVNGAANGSDLERYRRWFPDQIDGMDPSLYIRQITWSRPRDIVRLLNVAKEKRPNDTAFTKYVFEDLMRDYSKGSKEELRGELEASYPPSEIEDIFECFVMLPEHFTLKEFRERLEEIGWESVPGHDAASVLGDLYRIGAIGQAVGDDVMWSYQGETYSRRLVNVVHRGLAQALRVIVQKKNDAHYNTEQDRIKQEEAERKTREQEEYPEAERKKKEQEEADRIEKDRQEAEKTKQETFNQKYKNSDLKNVSDSDIKWLIDAAQTGLSDAQYSLGELYYYGYGVKEDLSEAVKWYLKAAEQGHAKAQNNLGCMYENGKGVPKSDEEAVKWYRKAAEHGNANAQFNLGVMYKNGTGVSQSYEEAVEWYRKAVEQGDASAQYNLGNMYRNGQGVTQSDEEAMKWYRKAAEQGIAAAQCNLGYMYSNGKGVSQSYEEAVEWWRKAAEQGHATAQYNLAVWYETGSGVEKNIEEAKKWYKLAADQGDEDAKKRLEELG